MLYTSKPRMQTAEVDDLLKIGGLACPHRTFTRSNAQRKLIMGKARATQSDIIVSIAVWV